MTKVREINVGLCWNLRASKKSIQRTKPRTNTVGFLLVFRNRIPSVQYSTKHES